MKGTDLRGKKCGCQGSFFTPRMCAYIRHQVPVLWEGRKSVSFGILEEVTLKYNLKKIISWVDVKSRERVSICWRELASEKACVLAMG